MKKRQSNGRLRSWVTSLVGDLYGYYKRHLGLILIVIVGHIAWLAVFQLPYFNWFRSESILFLLFIDYYFIVRRHNVSLKQLILTAAATYLVGVLFAFVGIDAISEMIGVLVYGILAITIVREVIHLKRDEHRHG